MRRILNIDNDLNIFDIAQYHKYSTNSAVHTAMIVYKAVGIKEACHTEEFTNSWIYTLTIPSFIIYIHRGKYKW